MSQRKPKNIVIVGGSLGGLFMGVALKHLRKDLNIRILERNPTPLLHDQGAGVVAGPEVQQFFKAHDRTKTPLTVTSQQRLYLDKKGDIIHREHKQQQMTSWDLLYHLLRANFDGCESEYAKVPLPEDNEGTVSYEYGCQVTDVHVPENATSTSTSNSSNQLALESSNSEKSSDRAFTLHTSNPSSIASKEQATDTSRPTDFAFQDSAWDLSDPVRITYQDRSGHSTATDADLIIAADGPSSAIRAKYHPQVKRTYAGYVAWRGTVPENQVSQAAKDVFVEKFPFYHTENIQILAYTIPGEHGTTEIGKRLINFVWYVNYKEDSPEHVDLMTDKDGKRHHITLPAGVIREEIWSRQKEYAREVLPPQFAELVEKTEVPFIQAITDMIAPSAVLDSGRVLLIGDALAGLRPHTAMSTSQAAMNAMRLAEAIRNIIGGEGIERLQLWGEEVVDYAQRLQSHGVSIGDRSQFGAHPLSS